MDAAASVAARLIGTLFVERGLVSETQIQLALEVQQETGQQLGEILIERFGVARGEIAQVIAEQWQDQGKPAGPELEAALSESWRRLGEIFVMRGFVTQEQLDQALSRQRKTGERLGEALVALGAISKFHLAGALAEQMATADGSPAAETGDDAASGTLHQLPVRAAELVPDEVEQPGQPDESPELERQPDAPTLRAVEAVASEPEPVTPQAEPRVEAVAFVATSSGYVIVPLDGGPPEVGTTFELDGLGELEVLRHAASPLPLDTRMFVVAERRAPAAMSFSFAD